MRVPLDVTALSAKQESDRLLLAAESQERIGRAFHEAAHAVVAIRLGVPVEAISILTPEDSRVDLDRDPGPPERGMWLTLVYAGFWGGLYGAGAPMWAYLGSTRDRSQARFLFPEHCALKWHRKAQLLVRENWRTIQLLAVQLLRNGSVEAKDIAWIGQYFAARG